MKKINGSIFLINVLTLGILVSCGGRSNKATAVKSNYEPTWKSLAQHETPEWFEDAVFGIYFHWGIYSVPAFGCWGGRNMYMPEGGTIERTHHMTVFDK